MDIVNRLIENLDSSKRLLSFIGKNHIEISDCFQHINHNALNDYASVLSEKLTFTISNIESISISTPVLFKELVILILHYAVRSSDEFLFNIYFKLAISKDLQLPKFVMAASRYMIDYTNTSQTQQLVKQVIEDLSNAYEEEESTDFSLLVICNLLAIISIRFPFNETHYVLSRQQLKFQITDRLAHLHGNELLSRVMKLDPTYGEDISNDIKIIVDEFLGRSKTVYDFELGTHLIENQGEYYEILSTTAIKSISDIRKVAKEKFLAINDDSIFASLGHGVTILQEEKQLYGYLFAYGPMHMGKIRGCFDYINWGVFDSSTSIYDWGCGQGLGSLELLSELNKRNKTYDTVFLVEPSKIAIKRASLHISHFTKNFYTINKDLDSLTIADLPISSKRHFHILSNILDVELFSLHDFITLIKNCFKGTNYFMIVLPKINYIRSNRLTSFVKSFEKFSGFEVYANISEGKYQWIDGKTWTREMRIFKVDL